VQGGSYYDFSAWRQLETKSSDPVRRGVYARVIWQDAQGQPVTWEEPAKVGYAVGTVPRAEPEYPAEHHAKPHGEALPTRAARLDSA
jgi:hypothetical protein